MIDLRSDTLTIPDRSMLETILTAPLGDDGRLDDEGRGEDPTVNKLEDMSAALVGKQAGLLCTSGTMGNQAAVLTWCRPEIRYWSMTCSISTAAKNGLRSSFWTNEKAVYHLMKTSSLLQRKSKTSSEQVPSNCCVWKTPTTIPVAPVLRKPA